METMKQWFGLTDGHSDFTIENDSDANLFFGRKTLDKELKRRLKQAFRTSTPPKMVLYGEWGIGKTHTMRHMAYEIEHEMDLPATVVFVELPDITAKASFQVAHSALLDALGFERAKTWMLAYHTQHPDDAESQIQDFTQSGDIAKAFANLLAMGQGGRIA